VKVEVQVAAAVVPDKVHVVNEPVTPVCVRTTVPVGARKVPGEVSVTVTLQVEPWFTATGVVQETAVVVARLFTTILAVPLLNVCPVSPGYEAVTEEVPDVVAVNVEVQAADAVVPAKVHAVNDPVTPF